MIPETIAMQKLSTKDRLLQQMLMRVRPAFVAAWTKKLLRVKRCDFKNRFGTFHIDPVSQFASALLSARGYEPEMCHTLELFLKHSTVFVDIGANEGFFSIIGARLVGELGRVIAVEPQSRLRPVIERNLQLNYVSNVTLLQCAISDKDGDADLFISPNTNTGSTALHQSTRYSLPRETVSTTTLSGIFGAANIGVADLVKMDIEGFEYEAVTGSAKLFRSHKIRAFALEMHPTQIISRGLDPSAICRVLESAGYVLAKGLPTNVWVIGDA